MKYTKIIKSINWDSYLDSELNKYLSKFDPIHFSGGTSFYTLLERGTSDVEDELLNSLNTNIDFIEFTIWVDYNFISEDGASEKEIEIADKPNDYDNISYIDENLGTNVTQEQFQKWFKDNSDKILKWLKPQIIDYLNDDSNWSDLTVYNYEPDEDEY